MRALPLSMICSIALLLLPGAEVAAFDPGSVEEVEDCLRGNIPDTPSVQTLEFRQVDRRGDTLECRATAYQMRSEHWGDRRRLRIVFEKPNDVRGTEFVFHETDGCVDSWMFRPADRRTRRLPPCGGGGAVPCTDFTGEGLARLFQLNKPGETERLEDSRIEGRPVYVLATYPKRSAESEQNERSAYDMIKTLVGQQTCVVLREESYEAEECLKLLTVDPNSIREQDGFRYAERLRMEDLKEHTHTDVRAAELRLGCDLRRPLFDEKSMGRRIKSPKCD